MGSVGVIRHIDDLGRIVIPKEIRKRLDIKENDVLEINATAGGKIILRKYNENNEGK